MQEKGKEVMQTRKEREKGSGETGRGRDRGQAGIIPARKNKGPKVLALESAKALRLEKT